MSPMQERPRARGRHVVRGPRPAQGALIALLVVGGSVAACVSLEAQAPDRSAPPAIGPPPDLDLPAIVERRLSNGLPVWVVSMHEVPVVQVSVVLRIGSSEDPPARFGLASLTAAMLDEGAGTRDALEIADAIEYLGASLVTGSSYDASTIRLGVPVARLAQALPVMADVVQRPTFPEAELERLRRERLTRLLQARDDPGSIASAGFPRVLYGSEHRYGTGEIGTAATIERLTADDLRAFYRERYRPERAVVLVVGDITADAALALLEPAFGGWSDAGAAPARATLPAAAQPVARRVYLVDRPGAAQSEIRIGGIGAARASEDFFAIQVLNTVLGGSFTSRLNQNLREKHGYAYGAGSAFALRRFPGPFVASAAVQTDRTAEALTEFFRELDAIRQRVPPDELEKARNYLALGMPADFETTGQLIARLQELAVFELPRDYFDEYVDRLQAVTAADVERVARRYIRPDRFVVVVVGDRATIEPRIRALELGPLAVLSLDDVFGPAPQVASP
jgi:zinc protease